MNNEEKILEAVAQIQSTLNQHTKMFEQMDARLTKVEDDTHFTRILIEQDIDKKISLLAEGHELLVEKLDALEDVKGLAEETKAKVDVIYDVVSQHSVDIKEIKNSAVLPFPRKK